MRRLNETAKFAGRRERAGREGHEGWADRPLGRSQPRAFDVLPVRAPPTGCTHITRSSSRCRRAGGRHPDGRESCSGPGILIAPDAARHRAGGADRAPLRRAGEPGWGELRLCSGRKDQQLPDLPGGGTTRGDLGPPRARATPRWRQVGRQVLDGLLAAGAARRRPAHRAGGGLARARRAMPASVADAAGIACLSESRFSHLFVAQVGLPLRTHLLWRRLMRAVQERGEGAA